MEKQTYLNIHVSANQESNGKKFGFYSLVRENSQNLSREDLIDIIQSLDIAISDELLDIEYNSVVNDTLKELMDKVEDEDWN